MNASLLCAILLCHHFSSVDKMCDVLVPACSEQGQDSLLCFSCPNVSDPLRCNTSVSCAENQACFLDDRGTEFSMGCTDSQICGTSAATLVGRNIDGLWARSDWLESDTLSKRVTSTCHECCSRDYCNKYLCKHANPSQCTDDESLDCAKLASLFNVCQDIQKAKLTCPKFCNLCNLVDGQWSQWSTWSKCDVTCDAGNEVRTRTCTNPMPANGGLDCAGSSKETKACHAAPCPVHGGWSMWSSWGSCSQTCDVGLQRRDRSCSNPWPSLAGDHCFGDAHEDRICYSTPCADGGWSDWSSWGACSKTCDIGTRSRLRTCTNSTPSIMGRYCEGTPIEVDTCKIKTCADHKIGFLAKDGSSTDIQTFTTVLSNYGNGYNSSTGRFTTPIAGFYYIASTMTKVWDVYGPTTECRIRVNSANMIGTYTYPSDPSDFKSAYSLTLSGVFHLNKSDVVQIWCPQGANTLLKNFCSFTGVLVTAD